MKISAFVLTAAVLSLVQVAVDSPRILMLDRFWPGAGWVEVVLLALYAGFLAGVFKEPTRAKKYRPWIWRLFSLVFFTQLFLGLSGLERFLMTGKLHLPIPALIVAGPVYRGGGFFMLILFLSTVLLVGPAWCSHLCYIGSWDDLAARARKKPVSLPGWRIPLRIFVVIAVLVTAWLLNRSGQPSRTAAMVAIGFGLAGVLIMLLWSSRSGAMVHCVTWCPIGFFANWLGKLNPFRIRIGKDCNDCGVCTRACRYDALTKKDIVLRRPGRTCTLCGDCISSCNHAQIEYRFLGTGPSLARAAFVTLAVSLHAVFLGMARL